MSIDEKSQILSGVQWQESLLQAYRNYLLITQSIFLAINVGLLSSQTNSTYFFKKLYFGLPSVVIFLLGVSTLYHLNKAISERANAVDWWQKRLLMVDHKEGSTKHFVTFRIAKAHGFHQPTVEAHKLDDHEIDNLLRTGSPKARKVFGLFVPGFAITWVTLFIISTVDMLN